MPDYLKKNFFINLLIIIIIFSLDRISKFYVIFKSETNLSSSLYKSKFLNIDLIWNEGIAFGLLTFDKSFGYNVITTIIFFKIPNCMPNGFMRYSSLYKIIFNCTRRKVN